MFAEKTGQHALNLLEICRNSVPLCAPVPACNGDRGFSARAETSAGQVSAGECARDRAQSTLAGEQMSRAQGAVEMGLAMPAEGHQRRAVDKVRETQEHLEQAMEKQSQMQQSMAQMRGERGGQGGERTGETHAGGEPDIPAPELFQTAEAYREALLEGMAGDVPKEFETLKRRFYEDLVRQ